MSQLMHIAAPDGVAPGNGCTNVVAGTGRPTDVGHLPVIRGVLAHHVDTADPPASTAVAVPALSRPEFLVEIEALALVPA
jgi:enamine deaminase RidA (YjgF/YER057c/UK114 family)